MNKNKQPLLIAAAVVAAAVILLIIFGGPGVGNTFRPVPYKKPNSNLLSSKDVTRSFCPRPSSMRFNGTDWKAPGGWKTIDKPLTKQVGTFRKAQWQGVNLGEVICQYNGRRPGDFPINLQRLYGKTVLEPQDPNWKTTSDSSKTCTSSLVTSCPFFEIVQEDAKSYKQIYDDIFK